MHPNQGRKKRNSNLLLQYGIRDAVEVLAKNLIHTQFKYQA